MNKFKNSLKLRCSELHLAPHDLVEALAVRECELSFKHKVVKQLST